MDTGHFVFHQKKELIPQNSGKITFCVQWIFYVLSSINIILSVKSPLEDNCSIEQAPLCLPLGIFFDIFVYSLLHFTCVINHDDSFFFFDQITKIMLSFFDRFYYEQNIYYIGKLEYWADRINILLNILHSSRKAYSESYYSIVNDRSFQ